MAAPKKVESTDRIEEFTTTRPDGSTVTVRRNIETGVSELVGG